MTAHCPTYPRRHSAAPLMLLVCVVILAWLMLASYHAVATHGQAAINAQNCFNRDGQVMKQVMMDPLTGRRMSFCNQNGHWFVSIDKCEGSNVTCFPRSFAKSLRECLEYARRSGFTTPLPWGLP
jgi:hypothetical protein